MNFIYEPAEDSYLLSKTVKENIKKLIEANKNFTFLEIGSGSGIILKSAFDLGVKKKNIFSCDINSSAVARCKKLGFNCVKSNLFQKIKGKYNLIVFNPPYLPLDKNEPVDSRLVTTGGKIGSEVANKFLKQAKKYMSRNGRIFLVVSSLTKGLDFKGYKKKKIGEEKLFFEKLFVYELKM